MHVKTHESYHNSIKIKEYIARVGHQVILISFAVLLAHEEMQFKMIQYNLIIRFKLWHLCKIKQEFHKIITQLILHEKKKQKITTLIG